MSFVVKNMRSRTNSVQRRKRLERKTLEIATQHEHERQLQRLSGVIELVKHYLNMTILINGAAIITIFAYFGSIFRCEHGLEKTDHAIVLHFFPAIISYSLGIILGGLLAFFSWLSQTLYFYYDTGSKLGNLFRLFAALSGIASLMLFAVGSLLAVQAFAR